MGTPSKFAGTVEFTDTSSVTFAGSLSVTGTSNIPTLGGTSLTVNSDAVAGTDQDPYLALKGGDGGSEVIVTVLAQDSSADKISLRMLGGSSGTTEKATTFHIGNIATTANVGSTLTLEAGNGSANKPVSIANSAGALTGTASAGVTVSNTTSGNILLDNQATTGEIRLDLGTDTSATAVKIRNNSGTALLTVDGSGAATLAGALAMGSNKITGLAAGAGNGEAVRYEQAVRADHFTASGKMLIGSGSGTFTTVDAVNASAGAGDAGKIVRLNASGQIDSSMQASSAAPSSMTLTGGNARGSTNTGVVRYSGGAARSSGTGLTYNASSTLGDSITVSAAGVYALSATGSSASMGLVIIKAGAAIDNNADGSTAWAVTHIPATGNIPANCSNKVPLNAGDKVWVYMQTAPDGLGTMQNSLTVTGPLARG
jgi:hypothetical protein